MFICLLLFLEITKKARTATTTSAITVTRIERSIIFVKFEDKADGEGLSVGVCVGIWVGDGLGVEVCAEMGGIVCKIGVGVGGA